MSNNSFGQLLEQVRGTKPASYLGVPTPDELHQIYKLGFQGLAPKKNLGRPLKNLYEAIPWAKGIGKGKVNLAYLPVLHYEPTFGIWEPQTIGTCASHAARNAGMADYCLDALFGETVYKGRFATENIYAARGWSGEGSDPGVLSNYVGPNGSGGFLVRDVYTNGKETVDLSVLTAKTEQWAASRGSRGNPDWLDMIASKCKSEATVLIENWEMERDAHALGFGTHCGSNYGFSDTTDENGVATKSGSWNHSMARLGTVDTVWAANTYGGGITCVIQSWAKWNTQRGLPQGVSVQPGGAFWIQAKHADAMIRQQGSCFAQGGILGFGREHHDAIKYRSEQLREAIDAVLT